MVLEKVPVLPSIFPATVILRATELCFSRRPPFSPRLTWVVRPFSTMPVTTSKVCPLDISVGITMSISTRASFGPLDRVVTLTVALADCAALPMIRRTAVRSLPTTWKRPSTTSCGV